MVHLKKLLPAFFMLFLVQHTTISAQDGMQTCGSGAQSNICFGTIDARNKLSEKQTQRVKKAATLAIDVIHSPEFLKSLKDFQNTHADKDIHREYWAGFNAEESIDRISGGFQGLNINTYGRILGIFPRIAIAKEGVTRSNGYRDVRLYRGGLNRPLGAIAGTLVHEAAHKADYSHRNSKRQAIHRACEPPYVLGALAEKLIDPVAWEAKVKTPKDYCRYLIQKDNI